MLLNVWVLRWVFVHCSCCVVVGFGCWSWLWWACDVGCVLRCYFVVVSVGVWQFGLEIWCLLMLAVDLVCCEV